MIRSFQLYPSTCIGFIFCFSKFLFFCFFTILISLTFFFVISLFQSFVSYSFFNVIFVSFFVDKLNCFFVLSKVKGLPLIGIESLFQSGVIYSAGYSNCPLEYKSTSVGPYLVFICPL